MPRQELPILQISFHIFSYILRALKLLGLLALVLLEASFVVFSLDLEASFSIGADKRRSSPIERLCLIFLTQTPIKEALLPLSSPHRFD